MSLTNCPKCNHPVSYEGAKFCSNCGTEFPQSNVCKCGFEYVGNFCPMCGDKSISNPTKKHNRASLKKVVSIIATSFAIFVAALSIISVFFLGTVSQNQNTFTAQDILRLFDVAESLPRGNVYYFLVGVHIDWFDYIMALENVSAQNIAATLVSNVVLSLVVAASIAFTLIFGIKALVSGINALKSKSYTAPLNLTVKAALSYLLGAAAILFMYSRIYIVADASGEVFNVMGGGLNGYSHAAIIIVTLALIHLIVCHLIANASTLYNKQNLIWTIFSKAKTLLVALIVPCILASLINDVKFVTQYSNSYHLITQSSALNMLIELYNYNSLLPKNVMVDESAFVGALIGSIFVLLTTLATFVVLSKLLQNRIKNLTGTATDKGLLGAILLVSLVVTIWIATCFLAPAMQKIQAQLFTYFYTRTWESVYLVNAWLAAAFVLALHYLGVVIAEKVISKKRLQKVSNVEQAATLDQE